MTVNIQRLLLALLALALLPTFALAGEATVFAAGGSYWQGFLDFWVGALRKQNGVIMFVLGMGLICMFVITRAKWKK